MQLQKYQKNLKVKHKVYYKFSIELSICNLQPAELIKKVKRREHYEVSYQRMDVNSTGIASGSARSGPVGWGFTFCSIIDKKEEIQFIFAQLAMICELLHFDAGDAGNLISEVINARLICSIHNYSAAKRIVKAKKEYLLTIHCQRNA